MPPEPRPGALGEHSEPAPTEENVYLCTACNQEQGGGIADLGDRACSACGAHDAPHVYVPEERCLDTHERDRKYIEEVERERARLLDREAHYARLLGVTDGGKYRADWDGAIDRLLAELEVVKNERDLAVLTLAALTPADKPNQGAA